ncbi:MAG TPA: thiolase family protein, partial [Candidatus Eisenbacteria bacterium]|nr:thiolase family protein [Candidatus Eisenbacteria bacterium]
QRLLERLGLSLSDIAVLKNHNPFAVNDVVFTKVTGRDWANINNNGCPLVWGHPQGPTLTRVLIEALEEAVELGGGYVLVFGCAAGDVGIASLFRVS